MEKKDNTLRNILVVVIVVLLMLCGILYNKYSNVRVDLNISKQNEKAMNDTLRVTRNKVGDLEYSKFVLVATKDNLESLNKDLADELKKENGKVSELTKYIVVIKNKPGDTIVIPNDIITYPNGDKGLPWTYEKIYDKDNYRRISGVSNFNIDFSSITYTITPLDTKIFKDEIGFNVIQGLRENKNGDVEMFVRSDYPDFSLKDLNSVIIDPETHPVLKKFSKEAKQKKFGVGVFAGYGIYIDNFNNRAGLGAQIGVGVSYSLFNF